MPLVDVDCEMYCPVCKCIVPKEDAFIVVYHCKEVKGTIYQKPARAFHFNHFKNIRCRADLEIR